MMTLMVESVLQDARPLLFLMALLGEPELQETLVKIFYKPIQFNDSSLKYGLHEKNLEENSLVELKMRRDETILVTNTSRMAYIRETESLHVRSVASQILAGSSSQGSAQLIQSGDAHETLLAVLATIYYKEPFSDIAASTLVNHCRIINEGVIHPQTINGGGDTFDVVNMASSFRYEKLLGLLIADEGEGEWQRQAHTYAKRILIKLCCQGKLDDHSMASLLQIPQATSQACGLLSHSWFWLQPDFDGNNTFSKVHEDTMKTLHALLLDSATSTETRARVIHTFFRVLEYETKDTIVSVAGKLTEFLAMDANPTLQVATAEGFRYRSPPSSLTIVMSKFPGTLEALVALLASGTDDKVRLAAGETISFLSLCGDTAVKIALIPDALQILFDVFLSDQSVSSIAGAILGELSTVPANRIKFLEIEGSLESLGDIVAKMKGIWQATANEDLKSVERRASLAVGILGELALEKELREIIVTLPGIEEGLLFLQLVEMGRLIKSRDFIQIGTCRSTRALTILYYNSGDARFRDLPGLDNVLHELSWHAGSVLEAASSRVYVMVYWARVVAHMQLGAYGEALASLDLAEFHLYQIPIADKYEGSNLRDVWLTTSSEWYDQSGTYRAAENVLWDARIFLQTMLADHAGALFNLNKKLEQTQNWADYVTLAERGVVKWLFGDLEGALGDLNIAFQEAPKDNPLLSRSVYNILKHRGYVKHLMNDEVGAKEDAEHAQQVEHKVVIFAEDFDSRTAKNWNLLEIPINYLEFVL